ncbi:MAG: Maf family protein [Pseudomonadota bacterium]
MLDPKYRPLILASASPRRAELLKQLEVAFTVQAANIDETLRSKEAAQDYVVRLAEEKAQEVAKSSAPGAVILGADTTVEKSGEVLNKPTDRQDAARMLKMLSDATHEVHTGIALLIVGQEDSVKTLSVTTEVRFKPLRQTEIDRYIELGEPLDKAGAYGIQGLGGAFVAAITGSYTNVVGLPIQQTHELLQAFKVKTALS